MLAVTLHPQTRQWLAPGGTYCNPLTKTLASLELGASWRIQSQEASHQSWKPGWMKTDLPAAPVLSSRRLPSLSPPGLASQSPLCPLEPPCSGPGCKLPPVLSVPPSPLPYHAFPFRKPRGTFSSPSSSMVPQEGTGSRVVLQSKSVGVSVQEGVSLPATTIFDPSPSSFPFLSPTPQLPILSPVTHSVRRP